MISIVIPAFNEEKSIGKTLDSLVEQKTQQKFEVILVNNNSTDNTVSEAKKFDKKLILRVIDEHKKGRGTARATGHNYAKGDIIISTDADTLLPPHWLDAITKPFEDPQVVAVTGPWKMFGIHRATKFWLEKLQKIAELPFRIVFGHYWMTGFNMAVRKSAYEKCGGFNPDINAHEDIDLTMRIRKIGKIVYDNEAVAHSSGRRFRKGFLKGLVEYQILGIRYFLLGDRKIILDDKR
jgi:glycosyltransferase involved in cell wall biosynthesis